MGDSEDGLVLKLDSDGLLQQFVRLLIHTGCGFIDTQNLHDRKACYDLEVVYSLETEAAALWEVLRKIIRGKLTEFWFNGKKLQIKMYFCDNVNIFVL